MPFSGVRLQEGLLDFALFFLSKPKGREGMLKGGVKGGGGEGPRDKGALQIFPLKECLRNLFSSSPEWMRCSSIALRFSVDSFHISFVLHRFYVCVFVCVPFFGHVIHQ